MKYGLYEIKFQEVVENGIGLELKVFNKGSIGG
jgi:hypothetical protein